MWDYYETFLLKRSNFRAKKKPRKSGAKIDPSKMMNYPFFAERVMFKVMSSERTTSFK